MEAVQQKSTVEQAVVGDVMSKHVDTIASNASVLDAAQIMCEHQLRHLVVIDSATRPLGVISLRDILQYCVQRQKAGPIDASVWSLELTKLLTRDPVTVAPDARLSDVATLLARRVVGCLPVVDPSKRLVGVVNMVQVLKHALTGEAAVAGKAFQLFRPGTTERRNLPAYFRRSNGSLVLPLTSLGELQSQWQYARLGYDAAHGRILVKLVGDPQPGDMKLKRANMHGDGEYFVIDANDFTTHFNIDFKGRVYNIFGKDGSFVLMPRT